MRHTLLFILSIVATLLGCARDCKEVHAEADSALEGAIKCNSGDECVLVDATALGVSICQVPCSLGIRKTADRVELARTLNELTKGEGHCFDCTPASCVKATRATCNTTLGGCQTE